MGDNALQVFAKLLNSILDQMILSPIHGDEFFIVLDISNRIDLEEIVHRIDVSVEKYNESGDCPYKLDLSMGYAVYDYHSHMKAEEFEKQIDILMYENKQANKE